jgi:type I restriction enzyme M protein
VVRQALKDRFVEVLGELGGSAGNGRLRESLGWQDETYVQVKEELVSERLVIPGRGRGGSVSLADTSKPVDLFAASSPSASEDTAGTQPAADGHPRRSAARRSKPQKANGNGANLGFEAELFKAADKLRGNLEPSEYKHVALGLIFLKYISEAFEAHHAKLAAEEFADPEDPEEYLAENVFWVPEIARWSNLQAKARLPEIELPDGRKGGVGMLIDAAMDAIERPIRTRSRTSCRRPLAARR